MNGALILSHEEIVGLGISVLEIVAVVKQGLIDHTNKVTLLEPKTPLRPEPESFYTSMPCGNRNLGVLGLKLIQRPSQNKESAPSVFGTMFLNDYKTGELLSIMDATWLTSMRTGAVAALSIQNYALHPVKTVSIMGVGNVGLATIQCLIETVPSITEIKVLQHKNSVQRIRDRFPSATFKVTECFDLESLFVDTQVVITALTFAEKPFVKKEWLFNGLLALPLHMRGWQDCDPCFDKMFTDDLNHTKSWLYRFDGELGEILAGKKPGRESPDEKIIAYNYGIAVDDLAMAKLIYDCAVRMNVGTRMVLGNYNTRYLI